MTENLKVLSLGLGVVAVGAASFLYIQSTKVASMPTIVASAPAEVTATPNDETSDTGVETSAAAPVVAQQSGTSNAAAVAATLSALDTMFTEDYDDSSIDASFEDNLDQSYGI